MNDDLSMADYVDLVQVIRLRYGYDFSGYAQASLKRRMVRFMGHSAMPSVFELKYRLVNDEAFFNSMVQYLTVNVTEMFRDPAFYKTLKDDILPKLAAHPNIRIWHAGCSTGEEVYSMAILLKDAGLLDRTRIYASDLNPANLEKAASGVVQLEYMKEYTANYIQSGGTGDFSDYYTARYDRVILQKELRKNITFFQHNLVTDQVFNEFQLICCRNVFIYFNRELQNHVLKLFYDSLSPWGFLALGIKESLRFTEMRNAYETVHGAHKIYRRKR